MIKKIILTNKISGQSLGSYKADTKDEALHKMAKEAGYKSARDIPHFKPHEIIAHEIE